MTLFEILILGGLLLLLMIVALLIIKVSALGRIVNDGEAEGHLIRIDGRLSDMVTAAERREQATRTELSSQFRDNREEVAKAIAALGETVRKLGADQATQQQQFRDKLDEKMKELRTENSQKLDEMRRTVDEKLQTTLEKRLSESFKSVSERLEQVHKGLGEMQTLASGVGDLKRVLTNVKSRGGFGEKELEILITDFLNTDQYIANFDCGKKSGERVEFGIRVPGAGRDVYLPVDAKFPTEDYERLLNAAELNDQEAVKLAGAALEKAVLRFAKDVSGKYINPPHTTDWAVLFLPTEGLYAEVLRRPGLFERLQRDHRITIAGPTNLQVLLSTFRMGFRQVALQERANEVWDVLGTVKLEFGRFGDQIDRMGKSLTSALNHVETLDRRKRMMLRALKNVQAVEESTADALLEDKDSE
ncbi:DNA recombination protein RmuC [Kordiimonas sp.]|uniref:DNA recombination protein RmuC n=1 Tax=Kordiimonas sp. TaxID=1970157 RepID=UPI003A8F85B0